MLKADEKTIFRAAAKASQSSEFLHGLQKWRMLRLDGDKIWLRVLTEYDIRYILVMEI